MKTIAIITELFSKRCLLLYTIFSAIFLIHQLLQKGFQVTLPFLDAYLDMYLIMPLILPLIHLERILIWKTGFKYKLSILDIIVATLVIGCISEFLFPLLSERATGDLYDFVPLILGSITYYVFMR